jgi:hypothetical protein
MSPHRQTLLWKQNLARALALLEEHPNYASVQVTLHEREIAVLPRTPREAPPVNTEARWKLTLRVFDIRAESLLDLVSNLDQHKAYRIVLEDFARRAFQDYTGCDLDTFMWTTEQGFISEVQIRVSHWINEGFKRIASPNLRTADNERANDSQVVDLAAARKAFVLPLLEEKGMSRSKWATVAGVDPSVVYDYLAGESDPRPDNRKALAEALGFKATDLPE